jgi:hypothetical protein
MLTFDAEVGKPDNYHEDNTWQYPVDPGLSLAPPTPTPFHISLSGGHRSRRDVGGGTKLFITGWWWEEVARLV